MEKPYLEETRRWVEHFVVGLNLCPFAHSPFRNGRIRYVLYEQEDIVELARLLVQEAQWLSRQPAGEVETTLLVHPNALPDFYDYLDFLEEAELLIRENDLEGIIQVASFHPAYQFAGTEADAPENYTNRSPYPMLHLLREEALEQAIDSYNHPEQIPEQNIEKMNKLGQEGIEELWRKVRGK
ncbi:MAG: DUF1415 domain-containing protein [Phaeodactylibacter sp.]|nr:DUF1415 domain-containing protein [Phaeodactylibacter sp.]MCB9303915.1 DUF1415 domain-containing protein [Lewinellaceae bacterium]